uniref:MRN complex interacting protein n=1 Tax=Rousettus aegyptiacus TaxID=9407 RepID=A0A7J8FKC4_ROUAE|nr:MRN complex interacting protein [Rousettus aegyptiacus]
MVPPPQIRVLRCCSCRLFQAHQVKKNRKWTCKACGEKQSFLRTYGEGSGADCRRHVQKLNLLQGQVSEMSLRYSGLRGAWFSCLIFLWSGWWRCIVAKSLRFPGLPM